MSTAALAALLEDQGLLPSAAVWLLGTDQLDLTLTDSRVRALGLVITNVDEMVHGTIDGRGELHDRIRRWPSEACRPGRGAPSGSRVRRLADQRSRQR